MKNILSPTGENSFYPIRRFLVPFFLFLFIFSITNVRATDHVVGNGSGTLNITSMSGVSAGDRFVVAHGTYSGGVIGNVHDVTIINDASGTVSFTGQLNWGNSGDSMYNVTMAGTGYSGAQYGFIFSNISGDAIFGSDHHDRAIRFYNISFQGVAGNSISFAYSSSDGGPQTYYTGTEQTLRVSGLTIANCVFNKCYLGVKGSYVVNPTDGSQIIDSFDFHNNIITNLTSPGNFVDGMWTHVNFYNNNITYVGYNTQVDDVGVFFIGGSGQVHHNFMHGGRGYLARVFGMSLRANPGDTWLYDNVILATTNYSGFDVRSDSTTYHISGSYLGGTNVHVISNTVGNKGNDEGYVAPIVVINLFYEGATCEVKNNLGFNLYEGGNSYITTDYSSGTWKTDTSNNRYYPASSILNVLSDTNNLCALKAGSPLVGAGVSFSNITTDYSGRLRPSPPSVGAEEYSAASSSVSANAGSNQAITLPLDSVNLSGSASTVTGSTISSYSWSQTSGPNTATLSASTSVATKATGLVAGTYVFSLKVKDAKNDSSTGSVAITVNASNQAPVVSAGASQAITLPTSSVTLTGTATDATGTITTYLWAQVSGPGTATIAASSAIKTNITGLVAGTYVFRLTATDSKALTGSATVTITVSPAVSTVVVNAGATQSITLPASSVTLTGTATDATGTITTYLWAQVSGPGTATIAASSAIKTNITGLVAGTYVFRLTATDSKSLTGSATVTVTVSPAAQQQKTQSLSVAASANPSAMTMPYNAATLSVTVTDPALSNPSYLSTWSQISGPNTATLTMPTYSSPRVTGMVAGTYVFSVAIKDANGSATSTVTLTVSAAKTSALQAVAEAAPSDGAQHITAAAGSDTAIYSPSDSAVLDGSATAMPRGSTATYHWEQAAGPVGTAIESADSAITRVFGLREGKYLFALTVTGADGAFSIDTVQIFVAANSHAISGQSISVYPNPTTGSLNLVLNSPATGSVQVYVYDMRGNMVWAQAYSKASALFSSSADVSQLRAGTYTMQAVINQRTLLIAKFVKL